jgi:hypothetical protein
MVPIQNQQSGSADQTGKAMRHALAAERWLTEMGAVAIYL